MKNVLKSIFATILVFSFSSVCLADDPIKSDETKESISETKEFCLENIEKKDVCMIQTMNFILRVGR